jgi:hypothetical protein
MHTDMLIVISYELGKVHYIEGHKVEDAFLNWLQGTVILEKLTYSPNQLVKVMICFYSNKLIIVFARPDHWTPP